MTRQLLVALLLLPISASACDICGTFMGILPYDNQSSIGLFHRYRAFNGYASAGHSAYLFPADASYFGTGLFRQAARGSSHSHLGGGAQHSLSPRDYELFRVVELRVRWFVHDRLELTAIVPWVMNDALTDGARTNVTGLGDISVLVGYHLLVPKPIGRWRQRLIFGGGLKLPTGYYYAPGDDGRRIDLLLQAGNGMTEGMLYATYQLSHRAWVGALNGQVKISGWNYYRESYAPGWTGNVMLGRRFELGQQISVVPQLQLYGEFSEGLRFQAESLDEHRMQALLGGVGLDLFWRQLQFSASVKLPVTQQSFDHPQQAGRVTLGITYNLKRGLRVLS